MKKKATMAFLETALPECIIDIKINKEYKNIENLRNEMRYGVSNTSIIIEVPELENEKCLYQLLKTLNKM